MTTAFTQEIVTEKLIMHFSGIKVWATINCKPFSQVRDCSLSVTESVKRRYVISRLIGHVNLVCKEAIQLFWDS